MRRGWLRARLDNLLLPTRKVGTIVTIFPDTWPKDVQAAYDAAALAEDRARMAAIIVQETGEKVDVEDGALLKVIEVRTLDGGSA
jgi:exosome complex RNA-binding protein Rrp4